jgi:hypothetical protein
MKKSIIVFFIELIIVVVLNLIYKISIGKSFFILGIILLILSVLSLIGHKKNKDIEKELYIDSINRNYEKAFFNNQNEYKIYLFSLYLFLLGAINIGVAIIFDEKIRAIFI